MTPEAYLSILNEEADYLEAEAQAMREKLSRQKNEFYSLVCNADGGYLPSEEINISDVAALFWKLHFDLSTECILKEMQAKKYRAIARSRTVKIVNRISKIMNRFDR